MNKAKSVVEFYVLCNKLKDVVRTGWKDWHVTRDRVESIAEHVFGVQSLAIAMWSQYEYDLDIKKVIFMIAIHETEEIFIGDFNPWQMTKDEKNEIGHKAVHEFLKDMLKKDEIEALIHEFDERKSPEALFAHYCDKLECDIQSKLYDEENCVDITKQEGNDTARDPKVIELLEETGSFSTMWLRWHREKDNYDEFFKEVSLYVENNKISVKNKTIKIDTI